MLVTPSLIPQSHSTNFLSIPIRVPTFNGMAMSRRILVLSHKGGGTSSMLKHLEKKHPFHSLSKGKDGDQPLKIKPQATLDY